MFKPILSTNSTASNYGQINDMLRQLNNDQVTKVFKQSGGYSIINGKLPNNKYGTIYYDVNNVASILIGQNPVDGHMGIWLAKTGVDVITELEA